MPTYNEVKNIGPVVEAVMAVTKKIAGWQVELLVVDGFSPDGTAKAVRAIQKKHKNVHLLEVAKQGLGTAYTKGFEHAISHFSPAVLMEMDADLSHNPSVIPSFLRAIEEGADFVIGSRYIKGGSIPSDWGLHRKFFSVLGNIVIRLGFMKLRISDWTSGYRAIKLYIVKDALPHIRKYSGYVFQVAFLDRALKLGARIVEVPIHFADRRHGISKINAIQYTVQTLLYTFTHSSFVRYVLVGISGFSIDFGVSYVLIEHWHAALWLATLVSAEMAITSNFIWNNFWSFSYKRLEATPSTIVTKFIKFNIIASGSLAVQAVGIELLAALFGRQFWAIYKALIIVFVVIPYSYYMYNRVIWKEKKN